MPGTARYGLADFSIVETPPVMARTPLFPPHGGPHPLSRIQARQADSLDVVAEPMLRRLAGYWLALRAGRMMPTTSSRVSASPIR